MLPKLTNQKASYTRGNVQILTRLKNEGDIHVKPFGKIVVKNMFGKKVSENSNLILVDKPDSRANILPASTRRFVNDLPKKSLLGRYTIVANLGYSSGSGDLISAKSSFWYLPPWH